MKWGVWEGGRGQTSGHGLTQCDGSLKVANAEANGGGEGEGGGGKPIQIETPQSVSYNKSSKRNAERGKTNRVGNSAVGKCIAWPYREAVSADTPLTFHTHTHNDKNSSPSGPCSVLRSPSLPHALSATVNTSKRVCRGLSSGTFFIIC